MKSKEELNAIREAQKRQSWIENVKRIYGWDQKQAEASWAKVFNPEPVKSQLEEVDINYDFHEGKGENNELL